ncbi:MAG TPA: TlpA disulfide reductase family protein [bacterium]|nr:TlpA disulfide reductase family protein [bacterium]HPN41975.1 TlpA disulfide reductase family protein [bacterium]
MTRQVFVRNGRRLLIKIIFLVIFICLANISTFYGQEQPLKTGDTAPGIFLRNLNGQDFFLSDYCGEPRQPWKNLERVPVVISFFTTWCAPCMQEIPELQALEQQCNGKVKFFLIDVKEDHALVKDYCKQKGVSLPVLLDKYGVAAKNYGVEALPNLFVIDKKGVISFVQSGYDNTMPVRLKEHLFQE